MTFSRYYLKCKWFNWIPVVQLEKYQEIWTDQFISFRMNNEIICIQTCQCYKSTNDNHFEQSFDILTGSCFLWIFYMQWNANEPTMFGQITGIFLVPRNNAFWPGLTPFIQQPEFKALKFSMSSFAHMILIISAQVLHAFTSYSFPIQNFQYTITS